MSTEVENLKDDIRRVTEHHGGCNCKSVTLYFRDGEDDWNSMFEVEFSVNNDGTGVLKFECGGTYKFKLVE